MFSPLPPVKITAMAVCNALGNDVGTVRDALHAGRSGLTDSPIPLPFPTAVGVVRGDLPELPAELSAWSTRTARISYLLLQQMDAQLARVRERYRADRIAVVLGTSTAGADVTEQSYGHFLKHGSLPEGYDLWRHHTYGSVLHVVQALSGAKGPAWMVSTACTSSAKPFATAQRLLSADLADAVIVGGVDTLCSMTLLGFFSLDALSTTPCRPFGHKRDGINIGEGGGLLLIERGGDPIALLEGVGESSDAYHISAPHPEGRGAKEAMERALQMAGQSPDKVDHINAHGTGTPLNDSAEAAAISALFGDEVPVVSIKGYLGHTLGGAGATEAAISILTMQEGFVPACLGSDPRDERITINVPTRRLDGTYRRVLSNSFAFGGNNVSVLLRCP